MLQDNKLFQAKDEVSEHQQRWIEYLCSCGSRDEYQKIAEESKGAVFAIMKYRRILRSEGLGNVSFEAINTAHTQKDYIKLHRLLQELFLEPLSNVQFEFVVEKLDRIQDSLTKLYNRHMQDRNVRILSIVLTL